MALHSDDTVQNRDWASYARLRQEVRRCVEQKIRELVVLDPFRTVLHGNATNFSVVNNFEVTMLVESGCG